MLGWDFSPRLSGGVGSACRGLATALARAEGSPATEVLFVLPRLCGDEEPERVQLRASDERARRPEDAGAPSAAPAERLEPEPSPRRAEQAAPPDAGATLPPPAESLRLLAVDSPLRPYLAPDGYARAVQALLGRIQRAPPAPPAVRARAARAALRASAERARGGPRTAVAAAAPPRVPPYGLTLADEVERYARAVLALAQGERFDIVHAHDWMTFPAGMLLCEQAGKPLVAHFHSSEPERRGAGALPGIRAIEQAALSAAQRVLCVSEASARTLRAHYALEPARLRVLHNAYTPIPAAPADPRAERTVLYLGRLSEQKAPDVFLRAAARVLRAHPGARFVLAGEGELYPELRALAAELGLAERVRFTGFVGGEELARAFAAADAYVLSSSAEPFGISALEALSLGVPTIVPKGAGVTEVVRSVLRFTPGDVAELADKIAALLEHRVLRRELVEAGLREVRKLRWDRPARALRGIYDELAAPAP
jgi:glycosyltransferase involved in cell wall biosynthesis